MRGRGVGSHCRVEGSDECLDKEVMTSECLYLAVVQGSTETLRRTHN